MTEYPNIPTGMEPPEWDWLREQAEELADLGEQAVIVHIGVDGGMSLYCSRLGNKDAWIVGVDLDVSKFQGELAPDGTRGLDVELIQGNSHVVSVKWEHPIHFLFIDGDHSRSAVLADMLGWLPLVAEDGVVAFHDYGNRHYRWCIGVSEAVDAWDWRGWTEVPAVGSIKAFRKRGAGKGRKRESGRVAEPAG